MRIVVCTGPTLAAEEARTHLDAEYLSPVAQGDLYRAARGKPFAIGVIDGFFELVPAVWHKEILWALSEGIHVCGSASMGALRAAELHAFGMQGVGQIFEHYRDGVLEDDDEVAMQHAPAELGYRPLSEAMVNIRATLAAAEQHGVIGRESRAALTGIAKALHFADRTYAAAIGGVPPGRVPPAELESLRQWLPTGRIDQKRSDAIAMLHALRALRAAAPGPLRANFVFHSTKFWKAAVRAADAVPAPRHRDSPVHHMLSRLIGTADD